MEGFLFNLEMVSVLYMDIVPGWLSKRQERLRAQAEQRVREQGSSGKETERFGCIPGSGRRKHIQKALPPSSNPRFVCRGICIFFIFKIIQGFVSREMCQFNIFFCCPRMFERSVPWLGS